MEKVSVLFNVSVSATVSVIYSIAGIGIVKILGIGQSFGITTSVTQSVHYNGNSKYKERLTGYMYKVANWNTLLMALVTLNYIATYLTTQITAYSHTFKLIIKYENTQLECVKAHENYLIKGLNMTEYM